MLIRSCTGPWVIVRLETWNVQRSLKSCRDCHVISRRNLTMSLRRPATAAGSRKPNMPPPASTTSHRPKSALAKSTASAATTPSDDLPSDDLRQRFKKPPIPHDDESNIQVVIRCRRRSDREVQDGSSVIVTTSGPRGEDVTIETAAPSSILGMVTLPPTRTYPFDRVFGPEADQAMVYSEVVAPVLEQVLMGYNCTLFAYGQTGTGKTYVPSNVFQNHVLMMHV